MDFWTSTIATNDKSQENTNKDEAPASSGWGWGGFSGIMETVVKQSENILQMYKEDIQEFTKVISEDTTEAIKKGAKSTDLPLPDLSVLGLGKQSSKPKTPVVKKNKEEKIAVTPYVSRLLALQSDPSTYKNDPVDEKDFNEWKSHFVIAEKTDEISRLLATSEQVKEAHEKLVPVEVKYGQFWERYFYKIEKLSQEENRRKEIVKKAGSDMDEEELGWDEDGDVEENPSSTNETKEVEDYFDTLEEEKKEEKKEEKEEKRVEGVAAVEEQSISEEPKEQQKNIAPTEKVDSPKIAPKVVSKIEKVEKEEKEEEDWDSWE